MNHHRWSGRFLAVLVAALAWGALAFGGNYDWAHPPLILACTAAGAGLVLTAGGPVPAATVKGLALLAGAVALQLVPLPSPTLALVSPAATAVLLEYDLRYAMHPGAAHALTVSPRATALGLAFLAAFTLTLAGVARLSSRTLVRALAGGVVALGGFLAVTGIVQRALFNGRIYGFWTPLMDHFSPFGPFINRNHFAGWMLMATPLALGLMAASIDRRTAGGGSPRQRVLWLATPQASVVVLAGFAACAMGLSLVLTLSRSGIIAFGVAVAGAALVASRHRSWTRRALWLTGLVFGFGLIITWAGVDLVADRFGQHDTTALSGRLEIWRDTARIVRDFWLTGTGLNTYGVATLIYPIGLPGLHVREAHNEYLQLAAEGGLLLCLPILAALAAFAVEVRSRFRTSSRATYWIRLGAVTGIFAVAVQSTVEFSLQMPGNAALFATLCGIALHQPGPAQGRGHEPSSTDRDA